MTIGSKKLTNIVNYDVHLHVHDHGLSHHHVHAYVGV